MNNKWQNSLSEFLITWNYLSMIIFSMSIGRALFDTLKMEPVIILLLIFMIAYMIYRLQECFIELLKTKSWKDSLFVYLTFIGSVVYVVVFGIAFSTLLQ